MDTITVYLSVNFGGWRPTEVDPIHLTFPEAGASQHQQIAIAENAITMLEMFPGNSVTIVTHSEVVMLALRLAIAEGRLAPDQIRFFWVWAADGPDEEESVEQIALDELGRLVASPAARAMEKAFGVTCQLLLRLGELELQKLYPEVAALRKGGG